MERPDYKVLPRYCGSAPYYECSSESLTVPDQSLTVKEILRRYSNGMLPSGIYMDSGFEDDDESDLDDDYVSPEMRQDKDLTDLYGYESEAAMYRARAKEREEAQRSKEQNLFSQQAIGNEPSTSSSPSDV